MSLGVKAAIVLALMIGVGILMLLARRRNFEGVRRHYTTRRMRVPSQPQDEAKHDDPS